MDARILQILLDSFPKLLLPGFLYTIPLTVISFALGLALAVIVALIRVRQIPLLSQLAWFYVWVFRGTPLLVQLFVIFYGLPSAGLYVDAIPSAILAFSLNVGAYASETLRGAILAVPAGQKEAADACGLTYVQSMTSIILPQAFRSSLPALFNTFISLVKDTSLAANITVTELFMTAQRIVAVEYEPLWLYIEAGLIYLLFCTFLTWLQKHIETRWRLAA